MIGHVADSVISNPSGEGITFVELFDINKLYSIHYYLQICQPTVETAIAPTAMASLEAFSRCRCFQ